MISYLAPCTGPDYFLMRSSWYSVNLRLFSLFLFGVHHSVEERRLRVGGIAKVAYDTSLNCLYGNVFVNRNVERLWACH
jgi:hypothetical protein